MLDELDLVLAELADAMRPVRSIDLSRLSDLPRAAVARFGSAWSALSAARRLETVTTMVERAEADIHLNFHVILRECLNDSDGQIRRLAVEGLWEDEKPGLIGRLALLLAEDPVPEVRAAAATALGRFVLLGVLGEIAESAAQQAERALGVAWARPQESNDVRRRALESLAYAADHEVYDLIDEAYNDDDDLMRQSAVFAMGRSADQRWSRPVLAELRSCDPAMRFEAAISAGELGLAAAVQRLVLLMDDADSNVREASAEALGKIGGREARRALEDAIRGGDERLAHAAEDALDELTFNAIGLDEGAGDDGAGTLRRRGLEPDETDDEDLADEDEDDTRRSGAEFLEDDDPWDLEDDEPQDWYGDDEEEDEDHRGTDFF